MSYRPSLEPCPFCGGPGQIKDIPKPYRHGWIGCPECGILKNWTYSPKEAARIWNTRTVLTADLFDKEEIFPDCTVQILTNSATGETSVGWWPNGEAAL